MIPILGVCLGHQTIADAHGMRVKRNDRPVHGKASHIFHDGKGIFQGICNPTTATRYHSLIVERATVTPDFEISAWTAQDEVMGLRWKSPVGKAPMDGVQFHPESFLSTDGPQLLGNFLQTPLQMAKSAKTVQTAHSPGICVTTPSQGLDALA